MKANVLVFPGGMENGIEIYQSLKFCKEIELYSASANVDNQAFYLYKNNNIVRDVRQEGWVNDLNEVIKKNNIDIVYPANSFVIDALCKEKDNIEAKILLPDDEVLRITRSKKNTLALLKDNIPIPKLYENPKDINEYPIFIKPDCGYGSLGAKVINSKEELKDLDLNSFIMQEVLTGREYTVDCFSDNDGNLLFASGRERSRIRMATSMHAETVAEELNLLFKEYAQKILSKIKIKGAWFFQVKEDRDKKLKLLEIDVRIAGTMCYNRCHGINFPLLSIYQFLNLPVNILYNQSIPQKLDRCLKNRYILNYKYDTVYVDLDDTIIFRGKINTLLIQFLYQCINNKIKIILISKSLEKDKMEYLKKYKIAHIFDEIIWLKEEEDKSEYMKKTQAIYIDDSFSQRKNAYTRLAIPTFDASMIECLIDERI